MSEYTVEYIHSMLDQMEVTLRNARHNLDNIRNIDYFESKGIVKLQLVLEK